MTRSGKAGPYTKAAALGLFAEGARAHDDKPPASPDELWVAWSADPLPLLLIAGFALAYAAGVQRLWSRVGRGRGIAVRQVACFAAGIAVLAIALVSPLDRLGEVLFSAHMAQHILLTAAVPPLLLLGRPVTLIWALPVNARAATATWLRAGALPRIWRWMSRPAIAFLLEAAVLWGWHAPGAVHTALANEVIHTAMHLSFLTGGLLLWQTFAHTGRRRTAGYPVAVAASFMTMLHTGLLGALLTFAPRHLYPSYGELTPTWGFSPMEDQQLAGLLMWIVCGIIYMTVALWAVATWLQDLDRNSKNTTQARAAYRRPLQRPPA